MARGAALLVPGELGGQVEVGEHVAVGDDQPVLEDALVEREPDGPGGAERLFLDHVAEPHPLVDVAEHALHAADRNPQESTTSSTPCPCSQSSMKDRNGRPASGITAFGVV